MYTIKKVETKTGKVLETFEYKNVKTAMSSLDAFEMETINDKSVIFELVADD